MEEKTLAMELLHQIKSNTKKWFIAFIIVLAMFFISNIVWLYAWNLPIEETEESSIVTQDTEDYGVNNYIGNDGDINGETDNN